MRRSFEKMHGLGNDFAVFDARTVPMLLGYGRVRTLADRRTGIGFDQLVLLEPSAVATVRMRIWNADGGEAETCGNALRCVGRLLGGDITVESGGGLVPLRVGSAEVTAVLPPPRFGNVPGMLDVVNTASLAARWPCSGVPPVIVDVGNPHAVFFVGNHDVLDLEHFGPGIERDPAFPHGVNVAFAHVDAGGLDLVMWERGAGPTLACGSGGCAAAVAAIHSGLLGAGAVQVRQPGGTLSVDWAPGSPISMTGPAVHVFTGSIELP